MLPRKYYEFLLTSIFILAYLTLQFTANLQSQTIRNGSMDVVKATANKKVLELLTSWDNDIYFFTYRDNPIASLDGLNANEISCFGFEHRDRFFDFLDAAGIEYKERSINLVSPALLKFDKNTRLYLTWSKYASQLNGAVKVDFIEKEKSQYKDASEEIVQQTSNSEIFDYSKSIKFDDDLFMMFLKSDNGKIEPRGFGKIKIIEGKPYLWKPGQLVLSRYDIDYSGNNLEKGMAYKINDNYELLKVGIFDLSKSNTELLEDLRIIKIK